MISVMSQLSPLADLHKLNVAVAVRSLPSLSSKCLTEKLPLNATPPRSSDEEGIDETWCNRTRNFFPFLLLFTHLLIHFVI